MRSEQTNSKGEEGSERWGWHKTGQKDKEIKEEKDRMTRESYTKELRIDHPVQP